MKITVDLHSHSPYAGASGKVNFERLQFVMHIKGINVYGSGDILLEKWEQELDSAFPFDKKRNMWLLSDNHFLMPQTEIVITLPYAHNPAKRKLFHLVVLFSCKEEISFVRNVLRDCKTKLTIGRPFLKCSSQSELIDFLLYVKKHTQSAFIPAHVMTPEGVLGGRNPVASLAEIFQDALPAIDALESGLSADPLMLAGIAEQAHLPIISSSDAHSAAFDKLGREFTQLNVAEISSIGIIDAIRHKSIVQTVEFPPAEGRYYRTGHRGNRQGHHGSALVCLDVHQECCPICGKPFIPGVRDRLQTISPHASMVQPFVYQIPLIQVIAHSLGVGIRTKKAECMYMDAVNKVGQESNIWLEESCDELSEVLPDFVVASIDKIKQKTFEIIHGYDGEYGKIWF
jgi:uncharacterized protein (TIGR00375 family)